MQHAKKMPVKYNLLLKWIMALPTPTVFDLTVAQIGVHWIILKQFWPKSLRKYENYEQKFIYILRQSVT